VFEDEGGREHTFDIGDPVEGFADRAVAIRFEHHEDPAMIRHHHLGAIERFMYAENAQRRPSLYPGHGRELADGVEAVRGFFERCHAESMAIFGRLSDSDLQEKCVTPAGASIAVGKWLRLMVEHEIHHRGQLYMALGMLGVATPPIYGLTSEQVRERSPRS
jgi:uncharacterized damage-inducible protein DinB